MLSAMVGCLALLLLLLDLLLFLGHDHVHGGGLLRQDGNLGHVLAGWHVIPSTLVSRQNDFASSLRRVSCWALAWLPEVLLLDGDGLAGLLHDRRPPAGLHLGHVPHRQLGLWLAGDVQALLLLVAIPHH